VGGRVATLIPSANDGGIEMRNVVWLVRGYVAVSLVTLAALIVFRHEAAAVTTAVWIRGTIVAAGSLVTLFLAIRAAGGDRRMLRRLRIVTSIMRVAIVVIIALPGTFPLWFKLEQGVCGLLLLPVVLLLRTSRATATLID
jgi:hypothetical protein